MSPLKIQLLLNLYAYGNPHEGYTFRQLTAPAMRSAFDDFTRLGLLVPEATHERFVIGTLPRPRLTSAGEYLVQRLTEVNP